MNIIAFSLWGNAHLYNWGALCNIEEAKKVYPGWRCRFYICPKVDPPSALEKLRDTDCELVTVEPGLGYFWRCFAASGPGVDRVIFRDCDSRVNSREAAAVAAWIESGKDFHLMRDAPIHGELLIPGGMWGVRGGVIPNMPQLVQDWAARNNTGKNHDEIFLAEVVWPIAKKRGILEHGSPASMLGTHGKGGVPFPEHEPIPYKYVGQAIWP